MTPSGVPASNGMQRAWRSRCRRLLRNAGGAGEQRGAATSLQAGSLASPSGSLEGIGPRWHRSGIGAATVHIFPRRSTSSRAKRRLAPRRLRRLSRAARPSITPPMLKLFIGNKAYSSWSMRGWLALKQSGLTFEEIVVPLYDEDWDKRREGAEFAPSSGKVPILWDGDVGRLGQPRDRRISRREGRARPLLAGGRRRPRDGAIDGGGDAFGLPEPAPRAFDERAPHLPHARSVARRAAGRAAHRLALGARRARASAAAATSCSAIMARPT